MNKKLLTLLLLISTCTHTTEKSEIGPLPFSFKEIQAVQNFALTKPRYLKASDAINLAYYPFITKNNQKIVILYAGAGLYGNKAYQSVAKNLLEKYNIGCYIFDLRGHGHSEGPRGDAPSMQCVWQDVQETLEFVHAQHPTSTISLAGHSSGAGLLINYAAYAADKKLNTDLITSYIFLAPWLGSQSNTDKVHQDPRESFVKNIRIWIYILGAFFPSWMAHFKTVFFNYPEEILKNDPLIIDIYTHAMSCATTPYEIKKLLPKINKPIGLFIGQNDEQFIPEKVIAYKELIPTSVDAKIIPNTAHLSILLDGSQLIANFIKKIR